MSRLRVAIVCPYSLSIFGGVQGQVLGLARALRRMGCETRVIAPCDGHLRRLIWGICQPHHDERATINCLKKAQVQGLCC